MRRSRLQQWLFRRVLDFQDEQQFGAFRKTRWRPSRRRVKTAFIRLGGYAAIVAIWMIVIIISHGPQSFPLFLGQLFLMYASLFAWSMCVSYFVLRRELPRQVKRLSFEVCLSCGYNLKGNTSGACPECGAPYEHAKL